MSRSHHVCLALAAAVCLAACVSPSAGKLPATVATVNVNSTMLSEGRILGNVLVPLSALESGALAAVAPSQVLSNASSTVISNASSTVISNASSTVISNGSSTYRTAALGTQVLAGAAVFLADAQGNPLPGIPMVQTDAQGNFVLPSVPADHNWVLCVRIANKAGHQGNLQVLVRSAATDISTRVSAASTLVTADVTQGKGGLVGDFDASAFTRSVQAVDQTLTEADLPDFSDPAQVLNAFNSLEKRVSTLETDVASLTSQVNQNQAQTQQQLTQLQQELAQLQAQQAASPSPAATTAASSSTMPVTPASPLLAASAPARPAATPAIASRSLQSFSVLDDAGLSLARFYHATVAINGKTVYVIGGNDGSNAIANVEVGYLNPDGTLKGSLGDAGIPLTTPRQKITAVVTGGYLTVVGGGTNTSRLASVEQAPIHADGTLGPFALASVSLNDARANYATAVIGSYLYVIGGYDNTGNTTASVERAPIQPDGTLGAFVASPGAVPALTIARSGPAAVVIGSALYVLGGNSNGTISGTIERASINADGTLGSFSSAGQPALSVPVAFGGAVVVDRYLYVLGGETSVSPFAVTNTVQRALIGTDGSLGPFETTGLPTLSHAWDGTQPLLSGANVYLLGGATGAPASPLAAIDHAVIQ